MGTPLLTRLSTLGFEDADAGPDDIQPSTARLEAWRRIIAAHRQALTALHRRAVEMPVAALTDELHALSLPALERLVDADGIDRRAKQRAATLQQRAADCLQAIAEPAARYIDWAQSYPWRAALFERHRGYGWLVPRAIVAADRQVRDGRQKAQQRRQAAAALIERLPQARRQLRETLARLILPCARLIRDIERIRVARQAELDDPARHYATHHGSRITLLDRAQRARQLEQHSAARIAWTSARQTVARLRTACILHREARLPRVGPAFASLLQHEDIIFDDVLIEALANNQAQCFAYEAMLDPYRDLIDGARHESRPADAARAADTENRG